MAKILDKLKKVVTKKVKEEKVVVSGFDPDVPEGKQREYR